MVEYQQSKEVKRVKGQDVISRQPRVEQDPRLESDQLRGMRSDVSVTRRSCARRLMCLTEETEVGAEKESWVYGEIGELL